MSSYTVLDSFLKQSRKAEREKLKLFIELEYRTHRTRSFVHSSATIKLKYLLKAIKINVLIYLFFLEQLSVVGFKNDYIHHVTSIVQVGF